jgi:hypothetical protein
VLSRWQGGLAALVVTLVTGALVILEVTDSGLRRWWAFHTLTTDTVAGLLVLLITVLVMDQVVRLRQINSRARAVAAQARSARKGHTRQKHRPGAFRLLGCRPSWGVTHV